MCPNMVPLLNPQVLGRNGLHVDALAAKNTTTTKYQLSQIYCII